MNERRDELTGVIGVRVVGAGSKSEMPMAVLALDDSDEVVPLRRRGARRLDVEEELARYDGRHVRVVGSRTWSTFVVDEVDET